MHTEEEEKLFEGLHLSSLELTNFRNYNQIKVPSFGMLNILIGPNAVGKTSIIEAIQLMTSYKSFRTSKISEAVRWGCNKAILKAHIEGVGRVLDETLSIENGKKTYMLNGKSRAASSLRGMLPAIVFCPDDLNLAKGPNSTRVQAVDDLGVQLSKGFSQVKSDYLRLIRQKNQALKDDVPDQILDSINEVLIKVSAQYTVHRRLVCEKIQPFLDEHYKNISGGKEQANIEYVYSWDTDTITTGQSSAMLSRNQVVEKLERALHEKKAEERDRKKAVVGAHTDKVFFTIDQRDALAYSSQGQQRSLVLAFKLAELGILKEEGGSQPLLLLDDVMSELDQIRRTYFMVCIDRATQTFVTTANEQYFSEDKLQDACIFNLPFT